MKGVMCKRTFTDRQIQVLGLFMFPLLPTVVISIHLVSVGHWHTLTRTPVFAQHSRTSTTHNVEHLLAPHFALVTLGNESKPLPFIMKNISITSPQASYSPTQDASAEKVIYLTL